MFEAARVPVLATALLVAALALAPAPADGARWLQQQPIALPDALIQQHSQQAAAHKPYTFTLDEALVAGRAPAKTRARNYSNKGRERPCSAQLLPVCSAAPPVAKTHTRTHARTHSHTNTHTNTDRTKKRRRRTVASPNKFVTFNNVEPSPF